MSTGTVAFSCFHCCCPGSRAPTPGRTPGRDSWAAHRSCSRPAVGLRGLGCMPAALRGSGRHRQCSRRLLSSRPSPLGPTELWGWPLIPCWPRWVIPGAGGGLSVLSYGESLSWAYKAPGSQSSVPGQSPPWLEQPGAEPIMGAGRGPSRRGVRVRDTCVLCCGSLAHGMQRGSFHSKPSSGLGHVGTQLGRAGLVHPHPSWKSQLGAGRPGPQPTAGEPPTGMCTGGGLGLTCPGWQHVRVLCRQLLRPFEMGNRGPRWF